MFKVRLKQHYTFLQKEWYHAAGEMHDGREAFQKEMRLKQTLTGYVFTLYRVLENVPIFTVHKFPT